MTTDARAQKLQEIRNLSDDEIHERLSKKIWGPETEEIAERELRMREQRETLKSLSNSAAATEKAAQASEKNAAETSRLVRETRFLVIGTFVMILITAFVGAILPHCEKRRASDLFLKELKHRLPSISSAMKQDIRMIEANSIRMSNNNDILNSLFELEEPDLSRIITHVRDTNVVISLNLVRGCVTMTNQKVRERNNIYEQLISSGPEAFNHQMLLEKEEAIKTTIENCLSTIDKAISQIDQVHTYKVETTIK